jgi:hypothetical protein
MLQRVLLAHHQRQHIWCCLLPGNSFQLHHWPLTSTSLSLLASAATKLWCAYSNSLLTTSIQQQSYLAAPALAASTCCQLLEKPLLQAAAAAAAATLRHTLYLAYAPTPCKSCCSSAAQPLKYVVFTKGIFVTTASLALPRTTSFTSVPALSYGFFT